MNRPKPYLYKNDHKYPGVNGTDLPVVILYAEIGTRKFNTFHKVLAEKAEEGKLIYVLRHFVAVSCRLFNLNLNQSFIRQTSRENACLRFIASPLVFQQEPKEQHVLLSGYGVELAVKSTEYKAVDDTQVKGIHSDTRFYRFSLIILRSLPYCYVCGVFFFLVLVFVFFPPSRFKINSHV